MQKNFDSAKEALEACRGGEGQGEEGGGSVQVRFKGRVSAAADEEGRRDRDKDRVSTREGAWNQV